MDCFLKYGWSSLELLASDTKVISILKQYLPKQSPHADGGPGDPDSEPQYKRRRVDQPRASASVPLPDHNFPANSLHPGSNNFDQATSSTNTVESTPGSSSIHDISFDARNWTRDLTDPATMSNLDCGFNGSEHLVDFTIESIIDYSVNSPDGFTDPTTASNLRYAVNSSDEITAMGALPNLHYGTNQLTDPSVVEHLRSTVEGSDKLTDPFIDMFFLEATSATQIMNDPIYPSRTNTSSLPNASTPGYIDPRTMSNPMAAGALGRMDC